MIEVRVREHHGVDAFRVDRKRRPVPQAQLFQPLKQPAIDEHAVIAKVEQMLRPGDGPCGAEKRQSGHSMTILEVMRRSDSCVVSGRRRSAPADADGPDRRAAEAAVARRHLRSRRRVSFSGVPAPEITWIDGDPLRHGARRRGRATGSKVDAASGAETPLFDAAKMEAALARLPGVNADEARRAARSRIADLQQRAYRGDRPSWPTTCTAIRSTTDAPCD